MKSIYQSPQEDSTETSLCLLAYRGLPSVHCFLCRGGSSSWGAKLLLKLPRVLFRSMIENHWVGALFPKLVRSRESTGTLIKDGFPGLAPDLWKQNFQERGLGKSIF